MRFFVSIDFTRKARKNFNFKQSRISEFMDTFYLFEFDDNIKISYCNYERDDKGLIEKNWILPFFNDDKYFIFKGGYLLFRNNFSLDGHLIPSNDDIIDIILNKEKRIHEYFKGIYYLLFYHKIKQEVTIYSSPMFMSPAFYSFENNHLIFTNHLEAFKDYCNLKLDIQGLVEYSLFDHQIFDRTIYEQVKLVPGGYKLVFNCTYKSVKYELMYDLVNWYKPTPGKKKEYLFPIYNSLKKAIDNYINNVENFNISLTGGFDGRLNFSLINREDYSRLQAFSYGIPDSPQITIPQEISKKMNFRYNPIILGKDFEDNFLHYGRLAIDLTCGITGFNRAVYPFAYNRIKEFSRSCIIGQCDMIRPMVEVSGDIIKNEFKKSIFFEGFKKFNELVNDNLVSFFNKNLYNDEILRQIFDTIADLYIKPYRQLDDMIKFYFFLLKESLMKYWQTEFHLNTIFVDYYVPFADLDYLETLFSSEYAGIYKPNYSNFAINKRKNHDLYIDIMKISNNELNYFMVDRNFKPILLSYGTFGFLLAGFMKLFFDKIKKKKYNDTFDPINWLKIFFNDTKTLILSKDDYFNIELFDEYLKKPNTDLGKFYYFNRAASLKIWLKKFGLI